MLLVVVALRERKSEKEAVNCDDTTDASWSLGLRALVASVRTHLVCPAAAAAAASATHRLMSATICS